MCVNKMLKNDNNNIIFTYLKISTYLHFILGQLKTLLKFTLKQKHTLYLVGNSSFINFIKNVAPNRLYKLKHLVNYILKI